VENHSEEELGSSAPVFSEPKPTFDDLSPISDIEIFEDVDTPERLKTIIRHMRKLAGRNELSILYELVPTPNGKRLVITFPEKDEATFVRALAEDLRREGVEDPAVCARLNKAHEQVQRAHAVVLAVETSAGACGALAGDMIEAINGIHVAYQNGHEHTARELVEQIHNQLTSPKHRAFVQFAEQCRGLRDKDKEHGEELDEPPTPHETDGNEVGS